MPRGCGDVPDGVGMIEQHHEVFMDNDLGVIVYRWRVNHPNRMVPPLHGH